MSLRRDNQISYDVQIDVDVDIWSVSWSLSHHVGQLLRQLLRDKLSLGWIDLSRHMRRTKRIMIAAWLGSGRSCKLLEWQILILRA